MVQAVPRMTEYPNLMNIPHEQEVKTAGTCFPPDQHGNGEDEPNASEEPIPVLGKIT